MVIPFPRIGGDAVRTDPGLPVSYPITRVITGEIYRERGLGERGWRGMKVHMVSNEEDGGAELLLTSNYEKECQMQTEVC